MSGLSERDIAALRYLLHPYEVQLTREVSGSDLAVYRGSSSDSSKPTIKVPTRCDWQDGSPEPRCYGNGIVDLPFDVLRVCSERIEAVMNPRVSFAYRAFTRLPFGYKVVPSSVRNFLLKLRELDWDLSRHLSNEVARRIVVQAFDLLGFRLQRKNLPSLVVTHDVDSEEGLRRGLSLKSVEDDLGIQSTWFLPSDEYVIDKEILKDLADACPIGSHDTKHDGKLMRIQRRRELVVRLRESRLKLEGVLGKEVKCFRSPLLQFNSMIVAALGEAGYRFDFSLPCWEPVHPSTMTGFGIESAQTFEIDGLLEVPLTLFQDHQVLHVMGFSTDEAVKLWVQQAKLIRSFDGDIVLLVHPEYAFSGDLRAYRDLLQSLQAVFSN